MFLPELKPGEDLLGIVIAVPEPWSSTIARIRSQGGDAAADKITPHITLLPPTPVEREQRERVLTHLQSVAESFAPFNLQLGGVETFEPISPVSFLAVTEGADKCAELAQAINAGPLSFEPRFPYHPHVTLAQDLPPQEQQQISEAAQDLQVAWTVPGFRLDRVDADGNYTSMALFNFA